MPLFITSLNSGSNGNCYYIGNGNEAVLVDAGISCRETENRMRRLGLSMQSVKAVFITHEHTDHISGAAQISRKYRLPVFITPTTLKHSRLSIEPHLVQHFRAFEPVSVGGISVHAFPKLHDAAEPHSFMVAGNGIKVGVFTDIGSPCAHVVEYFKQCHAAFLEANYDEDMLEQGAYPFHLKKRIRGEKGHLSNRQAMELFMGHKPAYMTHLLLSHLSKDNNRPELAHAAFAQGAGGTKIIVASRYEETAVYTITGNSSKSLINSQVQVNTKLVQASLF